MKKILFLVLILFFGCHTNNLEKAEKRSIEEKFTTKYHLNIIENFEYIKLHNSDLNNLKSLKSSFERFLTNEKLFIVTLCSVGDVIPHGMVKKTGLLKDKDFSFIFEEIKDDISYCDLAFLNLESPIKPDEANLWKGIPFVFNMPVEMVKELQNIGFNIFNMANNHMYDQQTSGITTTIDNLNKLEAKFIGIGKTYDESIKPLIVEKKGIKFGFIGYTTILNNNLNKYDNMDKKNAKDKHKKEVFVNKLNIDDAVDIVKELKKEVDVVVFSIHWGNEYHQTPSKEQKNIAQKIFDAGADVVLGHHPHVLQPIEYKNDKLIIYSMGNFISSQFFELKYKAARHKYANREGIIFYIDFQKTFENKTKITQYYYKPTYIIEEKSLISIAKLKKDDEKYKIIPPFMGFEYVNINVLNLLSRLKRSNEVIEKKSKKNKQKTK